ncbi:DNA repair helicase [Coniophora puteana RWD-64-598 SS2]|uniref:ATP-dependent DNA helicase CHL1 n=1 Tax=Coniophora puteana (strain RWD-64-598) TaxID=741705 RepID=A0A5M3MQD6_CONPW|nr:DNA repair helicase [Coniophora puteana RWD-64-598 SS2]EIW81280.1 DNA repair helicase [Coniophora puteana RWD-64-598 SS2]
MDLALPTPDTFPAFPYDPPYSIQTDLMRHVYASIEGRKVTIVESPTGTGKTLSLLCSSLTWLNDEKNRARKGLLEASTSTSTMPSWVSAHSIQVMQQQLEEREREYEERLGKARKNEARLRKLARARVHKKPRATQEASQDDELDDDYYLPEDHDTEGDGEGDNYSPAVRALMAKLVAMKGAGSKTTPEEQEPSCTKIYYASRTHSQLTQILPELRKLKFKLTSIPDTEPSHHGNQKEVSLKRRQEQAESDDDEGPSTPWRTASLGSRKQLCINDEVKAKHGDLDEKCRELLEEKGKKRCQYLPPLEEEHRLADLRDQILASPKDIVELAAAGRNSHICPYYGSRKAVPQAELVTLPYNLLLLKSAREALGIDLTGQVVIIDEAHNLIPTLLSISSSSLSFGTLSAALSQVTVYYKRFRNRFSPTHALHLKRLVEFMSSLQRFLKEKAASKPSTQEAMTVPDLGCALGHKVEGINLLEIVEYLKTSKVARKVSGYCEKEAIRKSEQESQHRTYTRGKGNPPLHAIESFITGISAASEDGRLILSLGRESDASDSEIKYQLLNPATIFRDVVDVARSVVLAGGTMSPISDVTNQLFPYLSDASLSTFSCGHIVPQSHVQALLVGKGPSGRTLDFSFGNQKDKQLVNELGRTIANFVNLVPGGMVVFFPSYTYLYFAKEMWGTSGIWDQLARKKQLFIEPREATGVESLLRAYSAAAITQPDDGTKGALLFAVVGGKVSEGLNFSDDMARAVMVVGLPFANKASIELQERLRYVKELESKISNKHLGAKNTASELYVNMCMSAVNQSIGRAIRHKMDWAALILVDHRFGTASIQGKLPQWIGAGIVPCDTFGSAVKQLSVFYRNKKERL